MGILHGRKTMDGSRLMVCGLPLTTLLGIAALLFQQP